MGHMTLGDYANSGSSFQNPRRGLLALHQQGFGALGSKKSRKRYAAALAAQQAHEKALDQIRAIQGRMESNLTKVERASGASREQSFMIQDLAQAIDHPSSFSLSQQAQDATFDIEALADEARSVFDTFEREFNNARSAAGTYATADLVGRAQSADTTIKSLAARMGRAASALSASVGRLQSLSKKASVASSAAASAEDARIRAEQDRFERERQANLREEEQIRAAEDRRFASEQAARERESALQQQAIDAQRMAAEEDRQAAAEERGRIVQFEQSRIDAELRREQMVIDAEERRLRRQQEGVLREEERELRREEREAQLQQLMLIQELAAKGLPTQFLPPGLAPPLPPGFQQQGAPGGFLPPGFAPQASGGFNPYGQAPPGFAPPGFAPQPGFAPPGYAATAPGQPPAFTQGAAPFQPPAFQQSQGVMAPQGAPPPPGMEWAAFDPAAEMFGMGGMGALQQTLNPSLGGSLIEEGYTIVGPDDNDMYRIYAPNGAPAAVQGFAAGAPISTARLTQGALRSANGQIIFVPGEGVGAGGASAAAVTSEIASTLREAIRATGDVLTERERRKAAKYGGGQAFPDLSIPGGFATSAPRASTAVYVGGALALGAGVLWFMNKGPKKKKSS